MRTTGDHHSEGPSMVTTTTAEATAIGGDDRPVYTIEDLGLRAAPQTQHTFIGPTRSLYTLSTYEWIYWILSMITLVILMGITIDRLIALPSADPDFTFAFLLFWTTCFCFVYVIQGVFRERAFELIAFVATITIVLVYVIFNYSANQSHSSIKIARLTITCLFAPILIVGGIVFTMRYLRSKNLIFRTVGANAEMQRICEILFAAQSLLKFDVQLAGSSLILWLRKGFRHWDQTDQIVVSIGSIVTIAWISLGLLAMRFENKPTVYVFLATSIFEPIIIIWNLVRYSEGVDDEVLELSVYTSGIIALIVRITTCVVMIFVMFNFNKGLKHKVYGIKETIDTSSQSPTEPIVT